MPNLEAQPQNRERPQKGIPHSDFHPAREFASVLNSQPREQKVLADGSLVFPDNVIGPSVADRQHAEDIFQSMTNEGFAVVDQASPVGTTLSLGERILYGVKQATSEAFQFADSLSGKRLRLVAAPVALALVTAACGTGIVKPAGENQVDISQKPTPAAAISAPQGTEGPYRVNIPIAGKGATLPPPLPTETAVPTPEPTKTPEVLANCKFIPEQYCNNAEITPYSDATGDSELVTITLPPNVTLTAPVSTLRYDTADAAEAPFSGAYASFSPGNGGAGISVQGDFTLLKKAPAGITMEVGTPFAVTTETTGNNLNGVTVVIQIAKRNPETKKWHTPKEEVEKYFPGIYKKTAKKAIRYDGPIKGITTYHYSGGKDDK